MPTNRLNPAGPCALPGFAELDSMPVVEAEVEPTPSISPVDDLPDVLDMTDDECFARLVALVEAQEPADLEEMAQLIARLAVTIE
jgi:hypothetical protein